MKAGTDFTAELRGVWSSNKNQPLYEESLLVRLLMTALILLRIFSLGKLKDFFVLGRPFRKFYAEAYVIVSGVALALLLKWRQLAICQRGYIAAYVVGELVIYRIYFLLVKSRTEPWQLLQLRRSVILVLVNISEVVMGFAIMYQSFARIGPAGAAATALDSDSAVYFSIVTLTTAGFGDFVPLDPPSRLLTASELGVGILLLVLVIPALISGLTEELHRRSSPPEVPPQAEGNP